MAARAHRRQIKPARHGRSPGVTQSRAHAIASCVEAMAVPTRGFHGRRGEGGSPAARSPNRRCPVRWCLVSKKARSCARSPAAPSLAARARARWPLRRAVPSPGPLRARQTGGAVAAARTDDGGGEGCARRPCPPGRPRSFSSCSTQSWRSYIARRPSTGGEGEERRRGRGQGRGQGKP